MSCRTAGVHTQDVHPQVTLDNIMERAYDTQRNIITLACTTVGCELGLMQIKQRCHPLKSLPVDLSR